jgi:allantoinase
LENPLFDYSPIIRRPPLRLPDNARVAVYLGLNVEHFTFSKPALSLADFTAQTVPDPLNYGWRDYGPRVGVWRLMRILDDFGLRGTAIVNSDVCALYPAIIEEGMRRNWAWVAHGKNNTTLQSGMAEAQERAYVAEVTDILQAATGARPKGWLCPALNSTLNTNDILAEQGYTYTLDWTNDDQPYPLNVKRHRLLAVPYCSEVNDVALMLVHHQSTEDFYRAMVDQFDMLYSEGADSGRILGIGLHPFMIGQPFRAGSLVRALEHFAKHDRVWFTTSDEIAEHYLATLGASGA